MGKRRSVFPTRPGRRRPLAPVHDRVAMRRLQDELGHLQGDLQRLRWELDALATRSHATTLAERRSPLWAFIPQHIPDTLTAAQLWEIADRLDHGGRGAPGGPVMVAGISVPMLLGITDDTEEPVAVAILRWRESSSPDETSASSEGEMLAVLGDDPRPFAPVPVPRRSA
jgi:hypothetical protein